MPSDESLDRTRQSVGFPLDLLIVPIPPAYSQQFGDGFLGKSVADDLGGIAADNCIGRNVLCNSRLCAHDATVADGDARQDERPSADPDVIADLDATALSEALDGPTHHVVVDVGRRCAIGWVIAAAQKHDLASDRAKRTDLKR